MKIEIDLPVSGHLHEYRRLAAALDALATYLDRNERHDAPVPHHSARQVSECVRRAAESARSASYRGTL